MTITATATRERPIIMTGESIPGILDGSKTQTRRVIKGCAGTDVAFWPGMVHGGDFVRPEHCPYGKPGDRLWVRERFATIAHGREFGLKISYAADGEQAVIAEAPDREDRWRPVTGWKDRPSIHMPRWASRILLEVVSIRVERLQDISEADCWAEGVEAYDGTFSTAELVQRSSELRMAIDDIRPTYSLVWDQKNAKRGFPWASNPWVWAVEFRRLESGLAVPA